MNNFRTKEFPIDDYSTFSHIDFLNKLKVYANNRLIEKELCRDQYILTPDNYMKMNLIYARAQAKLPIVVMGETGVGKTSLLRFFVQKILNEHLEIFSIHAGVTLQTIMTKMQEFITMALQIMPLRIWIFFDEFNTNDNIGLLCEIICDRSLNNEKLPENMVLTAACNRYSLKTIKTKFDQNLRIKKKRSDDTDSDKLLHIVKPLPDTVILYIRGVRP